MAANERREERKLRSKEGRRVHKGHFLLLYIGYSLPFLLGRALNVGRGGGGGGGGGILTTIYLRHRLEEEEEKEEGAAASHSELHPAKNKSHYTRMLL